MNMDEAYNAKVAKLSHIINSKLIEKRDNLITKTSSIDEKIDSIKAKEEKIERDIRTECGLILERLKTAESNSFSTPKSHFFNFSNFHKFWKFTLLGNKVALLNHEMQVI